MLCRVVAYGCVCVGMIVFAVLVLCCRASRLLCVLCVCVIREVLAGLLVLCALCCRLPVALCLLWLCCLLCLLCGCPVGVACVACVVGVVCFAGLSIML